ALGARQTSENFFDKNGLIDFEKLTKSEKFQRAINKVIEVSTRGYNVALMCSEADPSECHRFSIISQYLAKHNFSVKHILKDGRIIDNENLIEELLKKYMSKLPKLPLLSQLTKEDSIDFIFKEINKKIIKLKQRSGQQ
ncbi:MAG: DUF488 domain-containing protein, partial [candidate division WOR-3 bacterium]